MNNENRGFVMFLLCLAATVAFVLLDKPIFGGVFAFATLGALVHTLR